MRGLGPSLAHAVSSLGPGIPNEDKPDQESKWRRNPSDENIHFFPGVIATFQVSDN